MKISTILRGIHSDEVFYFLRARRRPISSSEWGKGSGSSSLESSSISKNSEFSGAVIHIPPTQGIGAYFFLTRDLNFPTQRSC